MMTMSSSTNMAATQTQEQSRRERIGVSVGAPAIQTLLRTIDEAEAAGVAQLWMTQGPTSLDSLTVYAAAFTHSQRIRLGTSIIPTYPRHPLALAQQAATVNALGPGRLQLGVGTSHRPSIEGTYGLAMVTPLAHLREYVEVLRAALWMGEVDHQGQFFTARAKLNQTPRLPILIAALGEQAYRLAGTVSDGAISWNSPPSYLRDVALPALRAGAIGAGRQTPPLIAHIWVALSNDKKAVVTAAKRELAGYGQLPFYANMFAAAGYPVEGADVSDALVEQLVIQGAEESVTQHLTELLDSGLDELLLKVVPTGDVAATQTRLFQLIGQL